MLKEKENTVTSEDGKVEVHIDFFESYQKWKSIAIIAICTLATVVGVFFGECVIRILEAL